MQNGDLRTQSTEDSITSTEETASLVEKSTSIPSSESRQRSRIGSFWQRLRDQRREAAAVVVLIVTAIVWFDTGSSRTGSASNAPDPLDGYEAVLSDFETVSASQPMCESADPFESSSKNTFGVGLSAAQTEDSVSANRPSAISGGSTPVPTARYPDDTQAFNASATNTSAGDGSDQQLSRRVKFVGRITPAN